MKLPKRFSVYFVQGHENGASPNGNELHEDQKQDLDVGGGKIEEPLR